MEDLIEAYLSVYEDSDIAKRAKNAVGHQRKGTHGDDHEMEKESEESTKAVKKATKYPGRQGPKVTPSLPESYDEFDEGFKRMNRDKIERQAKRLGGDKGDVLRAVADKMDTEVERKYSTSQARKNRAGGAGSEYRKGKELQARDDAKADFKKYGLPESVDLYDVVLEHLLDEGYADTEENAITIMANMSEAWIDGILDEAQIMSVYNKDKGVIKKINPNILRLQNAAARERQGRQETERSATNARNAARLDAANKKGIDRATNRSDRTDFTPGSALRANERDESPTDHGARRRRAKG